MREYPTFRILSTGAALVEVTSKGPVYQLPGGLNVDAGAFATGWLYLVDAPVRRWRVVGEPTTRTAIVITDSLVPGVVRVVRPGHKNTDEDRVCTMPRSGDKKAHMVTARGGDLVVASFLSE